MGTDNLPEPRVVLAQRETHKLTMPEDSEPRRLTSNYIVDMGKDIPVFSGKAVLVEGGIERPVTIKSKISFDRSPRLVFEAKGKADAGDIMRLFKNGAPEEPILKIADTSEFYGVLALKTTIGSRYSGKLLAQSANYRSSTAGLFSVKFHLTNFPAFFWRNGACRGKIAPIIAEFGSWSIFIESVCQPRKDVEDTARERSYLITHMGEVRKSDGSKFSPSEFEGVHEFLTYCLGFMSGGICGPFLTEGLDLDGNVIWRDQMPMRLARAKSHSHWFPRPYPTHIGDMLESAWARWQGTDEREPIQRAIEWYWQVVNVESNIIETRLVLAQVALELLSWVIMVEEGDRLSGEGFKKLPASDRIALLANQLQASRSIPSRFTDLMSASTTHKWVSASQALAEIRNKIIHPEKKGRGVVVEIDGLAKHQVCEWAVWLVELSILHLLKYRGRHDSRVADAEQNFPFVPWVDPYQAGAEAGAKA
jgi:hypothetical protein